MIEQIPSTLLGELRAARAAESNATTALHDNTASIREHEQRVADAQARLDGKRARRPALTEAQREAERKLNALKDSIVRGPLNLALAADILRRQARDPLDTQITELAEQLQARTPSELDTPINQKYRLDPIIARALMLAPVTPEIYRANSIAFNVTWPQLRDKIITEAEQATAEPSEPKAA